MEAYTDFASIYDLFMDNVPYEEWADRIDAILKEYDEKIIPEGDEALASEAGLLVDLGCGTGTLTRLMALRGYDCIGIDSSYEMLEIARYKSVEDIDSEDIPGIMYLNQDMREFELYSTVGAVVSVCDCVNYLLTEDDLLKTFKLVDNYLYPRGLFIFDFNTVHKYRDVIGNTTIAENREEGSFIWENYYDDANQINEYDLTMYIDSRILGEPDETDGDEDEEPVYIRSCETHVQRGYEPDVMIELVKKAGLEIVKIFDSDTGEAVGAESERVCVVAREVKKNGACKSEITD